MELQGSCVAVTGATGFLGSHIALALADAGARVLGVVRTPARGEWLRARGVELVAGDLTDPASLLAALSREGGVDALVSNAALGSGQGELADFERVNCDGVRALFDACGARGVGRVVHISSTAVYRNRLYRAMTEDHEPYPTDRRRFTVSDLSTDWRYMRTKALAERIAWERAAAHGIALTALRPGPVYGSRDPKATADLVRKLTGSRLRAVPTVGVPWVHAGDVALAVVSALRSDASAGRTYTLAGEPVSLYRFMRGLRRALGRGAWLVPVPIPAWVRYDTRRAREELGFVPRDLAAGLAEAVAELGPLSR